MDCSSCKFFNDNRCLRYPPASTQYGEALYPRVTDSSPACGEFAEAVPIIPNEIKTTKKRTINKKEIEQ